jgi:DNA-nicking Smr family endonuclease
MARRALSESDREAWALYAQHVAALPGRAAPALPLPASTPAAPAPKLEAAPQAPARPRSPGYLEVGHQPGGVDNSTWGKLRTGKLRATRTLDLHGRTAQAAFLALQTFLHHAHADRVRVVEIITGRGAGEGGGVIRRELPLWLNLPPLRPLVLAVTHPHQANVGAVRLLLRKPR